MGVLFSYFSSMGCSLLVHAKVWYGMVHDKTYDEAFASKGSSSTCNLHEIAVGLFCSLLTLILDVMIACLPLLLQNSSNWTKSMTGEDSSIPQANLPSRVSIKSEDQH
eukprot:2812256-Amphidinium_carterae.2